MALEQQGGLGLGRFRRLGMARQPMSRVATRGRGQSTERRLGGLAALCTMLGSLALRWTIFEAGKTSSEDQAASFDLSRA